MKRSKFIPVYSKSGKTNIRFTEGKTGVYLIKKDNRILYVGYSAFNLYRVITRHFQTWNDPTQRRVTYAQNPAYKVRVVFCAGKQAARLEEALILKHRPRDNEQKLQLFSATEREKILKTYEDSDYLPF